MMNENELKQWHEIGNRLTHRLGVCNCQRKLKSFVLILLEIHRKCSDSDWANITSEELMICALLEHRDIIDHGTNAEYPIWMDQEFAEWLKSIKDDPILQDN